MEGDLPERDRAAWMRVERWQTGERIATKPEGTPHARAETALVSDLGTLAMS
jgi:hypothetical protein